jgi:hypothetical protein
MNYRNSLRVYSAIVATVLGLFWASASHAQTYNAVSDFTGLNPSGAWSYLWSTSVGASLSPLSTPLAINSQDSGVYNGLSVPNSVRVDRNFGPGTTSFGTIVVPTNLLDIDPQGDVADVRWTAPATADYSVGGLFQGIDVSEAGHEVQIVPDGNTNSPLLANGLSNYGQQVPFSFSEQLSAGETLDFITNSTGGFQFFSTGLTATISVVPEPASLSLLALAVPSMLARRRSRA